MINRISEFSLKSRDGMLEVFEEIALELRQQYSMAFFPSSFIPDGRKRHIKVKVELPSGSPRLAVRYRKSYYAARQIPADGHRVIVP